MSKVIVILGPTASGKTNLTIKLAKKFNGELISADSRQIYKGMDIGTAKPNFSHHFIDIKNPNQDYSVAEYKRDVIKAIDKIISSGKIPILVGGTGLYISAVVNNWQIPQIKQNKKLRTKLEKEIKENGLNFVFKKLVKLDPRAACIIDPKNPRRVIRALEIAMLSGKKFSEQRKKGKPLYNFLQIGIKIPDEILKKRITERVKKMIDSGLIQEVKKLIKKYGKNQKAFDAIGYREIIDYLNGEMTLIEAKKLISLNTWHFAKRQITWFKKYSPKARWIKNYSEAEKLVRKFL